MMWNRREVGGDDERILRRNLRRHPELIGADGQSADPDMRALQHLCSENGDVAQTQAVRNRITVSAPNAHLLHAPLGAAIARRQYFIKWPPTWDLSVTGQKRRCLKAPRQSRQSRRR